MYSNGGGLGISVRENARRTGWHPNENDKPFKNVKSFVRCLCPKCSILHNVYMLWTGRGMPRKYCVNCKPLVSGYDDAAVYEASVSTSGGNSRKKGRRFEGE